LIQKDTLYHAIHTYIDVIKPTTLENILSVVHMVVKLNLHIYCFDLTSMRCLRM